MKDGNDYLQPAEKGPKPQVHSRVVDILCRGSSPNYILTSSRPKHNKAEDFEKKFDRVRVVETVRQHI